MCENCPDWWTGSRCYDYVVNGPVAEEVVEAPSEP